MKKLIIELILVLLAGCSLYMFFTRKKDYSIDYDYKDYTIKETYKKDENSYYFSVKKDDYQFEFVTDKIDTRKKKIVKNINNVTKNGYYCIDLDVKDKYFQFQCIKDSSYYDSYLAKVSIASDNNKVKSIDNIDIFNDNYDYFIWNGYGITDIKNNKKYNFLDNESYDNSFSYQLGNYILFGNYDAKREYDKLYIFNYKTQKINDFKLEYKLSKNSYILGDIDNKIYIFDKKNRKEYSLDIEKEEFVIESDTDGGKVYDGEWNYYSLNKFVYSDVSFSSTNIINYYLENNNLYYSYKNSNYKILISQNDISSIVLINDLDVYYLKDDSLYKYNIDTGEEKLAESFEWNFSSYNKIFIFN